MCDEGECANAHETLRELMARTTLVATVAQGRLQGGRYLAARNLTIAGRGTGVLLALDDDVVALTNSHVLLPWFNRRDEGVRLTLTIVPEGEEAANAHAGAARMPLDYRRNDDGSLALNEWGSPVPVDLHNHRDLGVVRLTARSAESARGIGKRPLSPAEIDAAPLAAGDRVRFRGYPAGAVEFDPYFGDALANGYTLFTNVLEVSDSLVVIDAREGAVCYGAGEAQRRDLRGISGSGVFDQRGHLRAVVWGGDPGAEVIYACPVRFAGEVIARLPGG